MIPQPRTGIVMVLLFYLIMPSLTSALSFAPIVGYLLLVLMLSEIAISWCSDILQSASLQNGGNKRVTNKKLVSPKMMTVSRSRFKATF